jgi:hypothetical protein
MYSVVAIGASVEWDVGWNNCAAGQGRKSQALNLRLGRDLQRACHYETY